MSNHDSSTASVEIEEAFHVADDGIRLYCCVHRPEEIQGVVLLIHGLGEHSGRYGHVIHALTAANVAVVRFDLRGNGRSDGERGHAASYEILLNDISLLFRWTQKRFPDQPLILYGHSLGGNLVANWCLRRKAEAFEAIGAVLSSPWFRLTIHPSAFKVSIIKSIASIWPNFPIPAKFRPKRLMRHLPAIDAYVHDQLIHRRVSVKLASSAFDAGQWALNHATEFPLPTLCMHGTADSITSPIATEEFSQRAPHSKLLIFQDFVHEPHNEPEWRMVVGEICNWVLSRIAEAAELEPAHRHAPTVQIKSL